MSREGVESVRMLESPFLNFQELAEPSRARVDKMR